MFFPRRLITSSVLLAGALQVTSPAAMAFGGRSMPPRPELSADEAAWKPVLAEDALEVAWSFRGQANVAGGGRIRVVFGWRDRKNFLALQIGPERGQSVARLFQIRGGVLRNLSASVRLPTSSGELGLQKVGNLVRVLWNGHSILQTSASFPGARFGTATRGAAQLQSEAPQPTETVAFRDDFMRAEGPESLEIPGEWRVAGVWKTSSTLGPKSDAALNPNPFVFRAQGAKNVARAGKWWWNRYSVSASVRASRDENAGAGGSLRAAIEAFAPQKGDGIRGEIDFSRGVAYLKTGNKTLAQARCDAETDQWHRMRLEPGPGVAKLWVDGVLVAQAPSDLAQGTVALRARADAGAHVDFDDVRVGENRGGEWGEGALPQQFQKDRLMSNWASNAKAWERAADGTWWHTGDFFGASQVTFPLPAWKDGQGAAIMWGKAAPAAYVSRQGEGYALWMRGSNGFESVPVRWHAKTGSLTFKLAPLGQKSSALTVMTGDKILVRGEVSGARGTKVGVRPLLGLSPGGQGQPWQAPTLQKLTLLSSTFEREGRAVVGVNITSVTPKIARQIGLPDDFGVVVDVVEPGSPGQLAGLLESDVVRAIDGARVTNIDTMRAAVGAVRPGTPVHLEILRSPRDASGADLRASSTLAGLDLSECIASTPQVLDYSFTTAPIDWRAARGTWDIAERWTCSPQWSFFAGQGDAAPLLWSRFATRGDWTLEAYLASPMDLVRGERSPSDLNLVVGGDGREISSGYSFIFGGKNRGVNQIRRGDAVAVEKPFEMPLGAGDVHQDWFYVRLERRQTAQGVRFKYTVNGREIADYLDKNPLPDGGHFGFWTQNGALSIARVRLWHSGLREPKRGGNAPILAALPRSKPLANDLGLWSARGQNREVSAQFVSLAPSIAQGKPILQISNPRSGGDWTTYVTRTPFDLENHSILSWDYRVPVGVKINLYAQIDGYWREIGFVAGLTPGQESEQLGQVPDVVADNTWRRARFDLGAALRRRGISTSRVEALAFAAPDQDYLRAGLGGNHMGATYWLRGFSAM